MTRHKHKQKSKKKKDREFKKSCTSLRQLLKKFTSEQWLHLIRDLNNSNRKGRFDRGESIRYKAEHSSRWRWWAL